MNITLRDDEPEFGFDRDEEGLITMTIKTREGVVRLEVGFSYDDAVGLSHSLTDALTKFNEAVITNWRDIPEEYDAYVTADRGGYFVMVENKEAPNNPYPTRDIALYECARLMAELGTFPNAWLSGEHGPATESCDDQVRAYHDEGGDQVKPLPGVQYAVGDAVIADGWSAEIVRDYGDLGITYAIFGGDQVDFTKDRTIVKTAEGASDT